LDSRLYHLQGKAKLVTETLALLQEFHRDKLAACLQHLAAARLVSQYDANNTYQYVINREETQLGWLTSAIAELGGPLPVDSGAPDRSGANEATVFAEDAAAAHAFVERWRGRVDALGDARRRRMLQVILGETLEHKRFFEQALAGRTDLLGIRSAAVGERAGQVLPTRWIE
jgi:hypothetical protein